MPPPAQTVQGGSTFDKMKMGALMGTMVGLTIGFIGGGARLLFAGPGPRGALRTLSNTMLTSAATFGFFLSIGSVIRTDSPLQYDAVSARRAPLLAASPYRSRPVRS